MKILHTADWHLGKTVNNYNLLEEQKDMLNKIKKIIFDSNIEVVLVCGDIFDRSVPSYEALKVFEDFIMDMSNNNKYVIAIIGNHDGQRLTFATEIFKKSNIYLIDTPNNIMINGVCFYMLPFMHLHEFRDYYKMDFKTTEEAYTYVSNNFSIDGSRYNVLLAHDYFTYNMEEIIKSDSEMDISLGGAECVDVSPFLKFNYVALGHIHRPQRVGREYIRYSGSILKYSFSEANHQKSVTIIDTDNGFYQIPLLPKRDMVVIKGNIEDLIKPEFYHQYNYENDYFKAVILNDEEIIDAYSKLKSIYPNLMEIYKEKINGVINTKKEDILTKNNLELFKDFYHEVTNLELNEEEESIVCRYLKEGQRNDI